MNDNRPHIIINLRPILQDFMLHEFNSTDDGAIILHERHDIGRFINTMWSISDKPVQKKEYKYPMKLIIPVQPGSAHILRYNFIYVSGWKHVQIMNYIDAEFKRRVRDFFSIGYEKKYKQTDIINAFLQAYNIKNNALNFDQVKKLDYRNRFRFREEIAKTIQNSIIQ